MKKWFFLLILVSVTNLLSAQNGTLKGRVYNGINNEPLPFVNIVLEGTNYGGSSDIDGNYKIENIPAGTYNVAASFVGYKKSVQSEIIITSARPTNLDIPMEEEASTLQAVEVVESPFSKLEESPLSVKTISASEIYRNPGGNRDISKVIQSFPGVAGTVSFRNDIIIRGGAPNENRFYLDGIEVPNINHFATQGSSGGPVGMINVNFIREVDFYSGAFPANRGNTLSSVMEFKQIEGNDEKLTGTFMLGSSDIGLTLNGPMGKKSNFIFSMRRSYLQFLFKALKLPFLPTYNDFQYKQVININKKNKLTLLGLGAIDQFALNTAVNDGVTDSSIIERNDYILGNLPINQQWNYTGGIKWQHFNEKSYQLFVLSRNQLNNTADKYRYNIEDPSNLLLNYNSTEAENKFRFEHVYRNKGWKISSGLAVESAQYTNKTYQQIVLNDSVFVVNFNSKLTLGKYAVFGQASKTFLKERLLLSLGIRTDISDYSKEMMNPLKQLSPRFSASYAVTEKLNVNFNIGRYYQLPSYTVLGYRNTDNVLVNQQNKVTYIDNNHIVAGIEYKPKKFTRITIEGFYKLYQNYPYLINKGISLANLGGDFGVIGNEPANSTSKGRSYGVEFFYQKKLSKAFYGIMSYTFVRSEFTNASGVYKPSSWDNIHILNLTGGYKWGKNWQFGTKFRLLGGSPYTPYNVSLSSQKAIWDISQQGVPDYSKVNTERLPLSHAIDMRIDKKWFFKKWSLNLYFDVQNIYNFKTPLQPYLTVVKDANGNPVTDPNNPNAYLLKTIPNNTGTVLPSTGIMIEF